MQVGLAARGEEEHEGTEYDTATDSNGPAMRLGGSLRCVAYSLGAACPHWLFRRNSIASPPMPMPYPR
jgi:hypothetical protein